MKFIDENLSLILGKIGRLYNDKGVPKIRAHQYLQNNARGKVISETSWYDLFKIREEGQKSLKDKLSEEQFRLLIDFLETYGISINKNPEQTITDIYSAISLFAEVSNNDDERARKLLPGYYETFRPAIGMPGYAIVGLLYIFEDEESGAIKTYEQMLYKTEIDERAHKHTFKGMAWHLRNYYLILTKDSNTEFVQSIALRSLQSDSVERILEGSYFTITNKSGNNIVCSRIVLKRLQKPLNGRKEWVKYLRGNSGYAHRESSKNKRDVPANIWDMINPEKEENLVKM